MLVDLVRKTENEKMEKGQGEEENQEFKREMFLKQCPVFCTLLFSVATVALMLFADSRTIFSLVSPKNVARG